MDKLTKFEEDILKEANQIMEKGLKTPKYIAEDPELSQIASKISDEKYQKALVEVLVEKRLEEKEREYNKRKSFLGKFFRRKN